MHISLGRVKVWKETYEVQLIGRSLVLREADAGIANGASTHPGTAPFNLLLFFQARAF
jgi:hypothetical protein